MKNVTLTDKETQVLSAIHMQANCSLEALQAETGIRADTIRYTLKRLKDRELIELNPIIDVYRLGLAQFGLFFSLSSESSESYKKLLDFLFESKQVAYVSELGGDFQLSVVVCAADPIEVEEFINEIADTFGAIFFEKLIAVRTGIRDYRVKHILGREHPVKCIEWRTTRERFSLDDLDKRILACVSKKSLTSASKIAREIGEAYSTVEGRLRRLHERKIIAGYRYLLNNYLLGIQSFLLLVYVQGLCTEFRREFSEFCLNNENIRYQVECLGAWDYEIGVEAFDPRVVNLLAQTIRRRYGAHISMIRVLPVFAYKKIVSFPF